MLSYDKVDETFERRRERIEFSEMPNIQNPHK